MFEEYQFICCTRSQGHFGGSIDLLIAYEFSVYLFILTRGFFLLLLKTKINKNLRSGKRCISPGAPCIQDMGSMRGAFPWNTTITSHLYPMSNHHFNCLQKTLKGSWYCLQKNFEGIMALCRLSSACAKYTRWY